MAKLIAQSHLRYPLDSILGNTGNVRVMRTLLEHGGAMSVSRLAKATRLTPQGTRLVLEALIGYGLIEVLGEGRSQLYHCVGTHPWYNPLAILFLTERSYWGGLMKKVKKLLEDDPDVVAAWLYGSVARGEDKPQSDVDLALLMRSGVDEDKVRSAFERLEIELHVKLSVVIVSEDDLKNRLVKDAWWNIVLTGGQQLKGEPRALLDAGPPSNPSDSP